MVCLFLTAFPSCLSSGNQWERACQMKGHISFYDKSIWWGSGKAICHFSFQKWDFCQSLMQQMDTLPCFKTWFLCFLYWGKEDALRIDKFDLIFNKMARNSLKQVISYHIFLCWFVRVVLIFFLSSLQRGRRNISWRIGAAEQLYILSGLILVWDHALLAVGLSSGKKKKKRRV